MQISLIHLLEWLKQKIVIKPYAGEYVEKWDDSYSADGNINHSG